MSNTVSKLDSVVENSSDRPLRVMFLITSMEVGGAETLLANMMQRFDPNRVVPSVACLKHQGELGEQLAEQGFAIHSHLIHGKYDALVLGRLKRLMKSEKIDAVITVGAGDKMFWGRLAAKRAKVPVILSALHSTGWPDGVGRLNRMLTNITDAFIAVAEPHRQFLVEFENFPETKVRLIPNGIDTDRFVFHVESRQAWRQQFSIPMKSPVCGIVAALRPEKNHELFVTVAEKVGQQIPDAHFLIVGDGPEREWIESVIRQKSCGARIHMAGNSHDIPGALSCMDLFALTSQNEASPVSILEAMSIGLPVVAPAVGSIDQAVIEGETGFLAAASDEAHFVELWTKVLNDEDLRRELGQRGRRHVLHYGSLQTMTEGYTQLVEHVFRSKRLGQSSPVSCPIVTTNLPATGATASHGSAGN